MDQPGKVADPARGQLNRENGVFLSSFVPPEILVPRETDLTVQSRVSLLLILHTQSESGAYSRDFSGFPPAAIGPVPSLSGHPIAYRWRSLPRVRQHRASSPQDCSSYGPGAACSGITIDQFFVRRYFSTPTIGTACIYV